MSSSPKQAARPLPWHQATWRHLSELLDQGRLPHAVLLEGPTGTGRNQFANAFARWLLCEQPEPEGPCEHCKACTLSASGAHSDLLRLQPEEEGKAIGIDAVRSAIGFVAATAALGTRKLLLVSPAESMTVAAFNAFLKCLEEPAPGTYIVLVAPRGHPLPATIRSRCQRWYLAAPESSEALAWLQAQHPEAGDSMLLEQLLDLTENRPLLAEQLVGSDETEALMALRAHSRREPALSEVQIEALVSKLGPDRFLDTLESLVRRNLRERNLEGLRSEGGLSGFAALETIASLRRARRSGSNPNVELLQFEALRACRGLWE